MKRKIYKIISCVLIISTLFSVLAISASALSWDGSSSGGSGAGSPAGPNGYAIRTSGDNCIGYRFSVVDKWGNTKGTRIIDVFRNTSYGNMEYSGAHKFDNKYNKKQIIDNQNNGFSSSKSTWNCYKESNMGFASSLPTPNGMNGWQNDSRNLNAVLVELGINKIPSLKNGDKVLVEPLFDIRLQGTYHSITVTEMAQYGKWLLGANSNGGSSSTSASWGFISKYTNQIYPNSLYTPDGQGLWSGVGSLGSRATFYNIINKGYGVGIAYTETRPDFTPNLQVNICEAWPGNKGNRQNHYGVSNGSSFGNYSYGNGYPIKGDKVWYAVNFPAESENCYVRQTVWVDGGGSTSRNVYSHSGTWYDVALSPTTVDAGRISYIVKARIDWIDGSGNVLKWGAEKTFYIPIRPKINRQQVTLTDITGKTSAYGGSSGYSGKVYVGQKVTAKYTYTSENSWTSYNHLRASMYQWKSGGWNRVKPWNAFTGDADLYVDNAGLNANSSYSKYSDLGQLRVPDNSANTNGANRIPFMLWTHWSSDVDRTHESTWIDIPVVKTDVELLDIKLINAKGQYITGKEVYAYETVTPRYIYKNNTDCTVYVEGYNDDNSRMSGTYAIPPNGTIHVNGKKMTIPYKQFFDVWGGVYLDGAGRTNTSWEKDDYESQHNNHWLRYWNVVHPLTIETITPNSNYREGTQVMTSFKVKNAALADFIPSNNISVRLSVYKGSSLLYSTTKSSVVIPSENENLVYFKWTVPSNLSGSYLTVKGEVLDNGKVIDKKQISVKSEKITNSQTPDTGYEGKKPTGWSSSSIPTAYANGATWSEWVYLGGGFQKKTYGVKIQNYPVVITPDYNSPSAALINDTWNMKSGYGFTSSTYVGRTFTGNPSSSAYTGVQHGYMQLPEFKYSAQTDKYRNLELVSSYFRLKANPAADGQRVHFLPLWYPNGTKNYVVSCYFYDQWTPAGMISARMNSNSFSINGSLYDDHYIGKN